jgi:hypothetical protein
MASLQPGDDLKYWLAEAEDMYNRACQRRVDVEAKDAAARAATVGAFEKFLATRREATATITATATTTAGGDDWQTMLERDKAGNLVSCGYNARLILSHATEVGEIRWNTLAKCIDVRGGLFTSLTGCSRRGASSCRRRW